MTTAIEFAVLGLGTGAAYTLLAQGLVLIYRGSAVVNFSQGALAMVSAFLYFQLHQQAGWAFLPAFIVSGGATVVIGLAIYQLIMRPLAGAARVTAAIATLGILILLEGIATLIWGTQPRGVNSELPTHTLRIAGVVVGEDKVILFGIAILITIALWVFSRRTRLGLALTANSENRRAASALGWSPHRLGMFTWGLGAALAAVAGILLAPITGATVDQMPLLVIPVLAAVLIGRFDSFPLTLLAATLIGIGQSEISNYWSLPGAAQAVPFAVIIVYLMIRGEQQLTRTSLAERLPEIGSGRIRLRTAIPAIAIPVVIIATVSSPNFISGLTVSLAWAIILLSVVVVLGYTGQLSLAQFAIGGLAALAAGHLVANLHFPFWLAVVISVGACVPLGMALALPAVRTRGISLAIVTLGLAVVASELIFNNGSITGGYDGIQVGATKLFGWDIDTILHPTRYVLVVFVLLVLCSLLVADVRRGTSGLRLMATRTNERAAAALGVNVVGAKLFAFGFGAALAGLGGILIAFANESITFSNVYAPLQSIQASAYGIVGGVGYVGGAPVGSTLAQGGIGNWLLNTIFPNANPVWLTVLAGVSLIILVIIQPDGAMKANIDTIRRITGLVSRRGGAVTAPEVEVSAPAAGSTALERSISPQPLSVRDVSVRFGAVKAVSGVSLELRPAEVVGLIGPNGAGKTTLVDAITGFVRITSGEVTLGEERIDGLRPYRRARAGVSRSFQSLELFESATVEENLRVACDAGSPVPYLTDFVRPRTAALTPEGIAALREFGLEDALHVLVRDLSYGRRRLVAIARAVAAGSSVLLLDEPGAGLSEAETRELGVVVRRLADEWGLGVIVIEHDMKFVMSVCDRIVVLNNGEKIAEGTPAEVGADPAVIFAYLGVTGETQDTSRPADQPSAGIAATTKGA
ncbi:MAG TPA: branched-chain amino acid ABC transporter permease/ATP-binding protein [Solirubrobacteraceae bacterium]|nr:branched-chain amino acid ABC transporter permease/ATP-binding protein [Solirubrobacteraceae bacterium]